MTEDTEKERAELKMTKTELIEQYYAGKIKELGTTVHKGKGVAICAVEFSDIDRVFGYIQYGLVKRFFFVRVHTDGDGEVRFNVGTRKFTVDEFAQIISYS